MDDFSKLAEVMADAAGVIARQYFRTGFAIDTKDDQSPVTQADREIELKLRALVKEHRPDDGIIGEEFGNVESKSGYTWVFDPIDGTKSFTIGRPTFGTLIGLCKDATPILGIIDQPISNERWIGVQGRPTLFNGQPVKTRACPNIKQAIFGTGSASQIGVERYQKLEAACRYMVFQGDCYFFGLMANGAIDGLVEDHLDIYDFIALVPIIEGAGGKITDWQGKPLTLESGSTLIATGDPSLHEALLAEIA
jgi:inositol-phosphate phosphatase/L-galactose 1-phosphate phosphatase/histidinol-phosphatase